MYPLQTIAAYLRFHLGRLDKLQGKVMTQKLEWWIILLVDCVTLFGLYYPSHSKGLTQLTLTDLK